jgi:hypothetical protein
MTTTIERSCELPVACRPKQDHTSCMEGNHLSSRKLRKLYNYFRLLIPSMRGIHGCSDKGSEAAHDL